LERSSSAPSPLRPLRKPPPKPRRRRRSGPFLRAADRQRPLAELVAESATTDPRDAQAECLASAVYWESKGEPLAGQLAVAEVIINRAASGRFAPTLCGVITQRSQFSFVRGGRIPAPPRTAAAWRTAVAIAHIASTTAPTRRSRPRSSSTPITSRRAGASAARLGRQPHLLPLSGSSSLRACDQQTPSQAQRVAGALHARFRSSPAEVPAFTGTT
jgi:hypothetical protein